MAEKNLSEAVIANLRAIAPVEGITIDESLHRLQWNENANGYPNDLKEEVLGRLARMDWARYPVQLRPFALCRKIANWLDVPEESVVVTGGSSDLIRVVMGALLGAGDTVVIPVPVFGQYTRYAKLAGATEVEIECRAEEEFALPVDEILAATKATQAKAIVLCAPNNPTGTVYSIEDLERIAAESNAIVLVDCAYLEFCNIDLMPLVRRHPNVIMLRTLSKAFAMAGVRVGYAVTSPQLAVELQKAVSAFPISIFSDITAQVAIENAERFMQGVRATIAERERVASALRALGVKVFPSGTNFLLVRPPTDGAKIVAHMRAQHNVLITDGGSWPQLRGYVRLSVGAPAQNDIVIQGFRESLA